MVSKMSQSEKAELFREMHRQPPIIRLCTIWDAASARIVEMAGAKAIATGSAGMDAALGYPDGELAPLDEVLWAVKRIVDRVDIPVTADIVAGYGKTPGEVAETARKLLATGAIGCNFEDSTGEGGGKLFTLDEQVARIKAVRKVADGAGIPFVLNARTDAFFSSQIPEDQRLDEAIRRANAYREAGSDCSLVLGARTPETIQRILNEVDGPLNVLASPASPTVPELEAMGVARVSVGGGPMFATLGLTRRIAGELFSDGTYDLIRDFALPRADIMSMYAEHD
ncbi:MAG TPA: isocitrate lyase/phosphoenolpyruvate mutase family protein [Thermomicrobiaceae bacterium]|nr:isocitrate lyase/phosphoenolpyruvate mutase family protein [Thermomicrobiaceae bacterium]